MGSGVLAFALVVEAVMLACFPPGGIGGGTAWRGTHTAAAGRRSCTCRGPAGAMPIFGRNAVMSPAPGWLPLAFSLFSSMPILVAVVSTMRALMVLQARPGRWPGAPGAGLTSCPCHRAAGGPTPSVSLRQSASNGGKSWNSSASARRCSHQQHHLGVHASARAAGACLCAAARSWSWLLGRLLMWHGRLRCRGLRSKRSEA